MSHSHNINHFTGKKKKPKGAKRGTKHKKTKQKDAKRKQKQHVNKYKTPKAKQIKERSL